MNKEKLFEAFPPISDEEWKEKIIKDLKGADFNKKLVWKTGEGFEVQPYYRQDDIKDLPHMEVLPGKFPYVRGKNVKENNWLVRQDICVKDIADANKKALDIRLRGVDSLGFKLDDNIKPSVENIECLTANIRADLMELNFKTSYPLEAMQSLDTLAKKFNRDLEKVLGSIEYDPIGSFSINGEFEGSEETAMSLIPALHAASAHLPNFHYINVDASIFNNAGAGIVNELAFTMAMGADYLTYMTENDLDIDEVAPHIRFHFAVGSDYFMEIAKFRAARYLWAKIVNAYGISNAEKATMNIHCSNSRWNKTVYDPYVNMLRTTTESMSAIIGGVDSLTVLPFNSIFEDETEFSERIARNQQLVLKGESYLDKVSDISAGSYYIEELTHKLIHAAWEQFLKVDELGGYTKAFKNGMIKETIDQEASKKNKEIATRRRSLLGTNQYPNITERLDGNSASAESKSNGEVEPLNLYRGAEELEQLRLNTDRYSENNKRPEAWMFAYGNLAMRKARSQFAGNFFGCAGYDITDNPGFSNIEEGIAAAKESKPEIIVICSSDDEYTDNAIKIYNELKDNSVIVLAGYPKDIIEELKEAGLTNFIHIRSNVLEELTRYNELLKIS